MTEDEIIQQLIYPRFHGDSTVDARKILQRIVEANGFRVGPTGAYYNRFRLFDRNEHETRLCTNKAYYEEWLTPRRAITGEDGLPDEFRKVFKTRPAKKAAPKPETHEYTEKAGQLTNLLIAEMLRNLPESKVPSPDNGAFGNWAREVDLMITRDHRDPKEIEKIILFCQRDDFWHKNIRSTGKLREKFEVLQLKMRSDGADWKQKPKTQKEQHEEFKARFLAGEKPKELEEEPDLET